jgi:hypothetical protein
MVSWLFLVAMGYTRCVSPNTGATILPAAHADFFSEGVKGCGIEDSQMACPLHRSNVTRFNQIFNSVQRYA